MLQHPFPIPSGILFAATVVGLAEIALGEKRKEGFVRIAAFVWTYLLSFVYGLLSIVFAIAALVDIVWQIATNNDGYGVDGFVSDWIHAWVYWYADMNAYVLSGRDCPNWLPSREEGAR